MAQLAGLLAVVALLFGGFLLAGGSAEVLLKAGPAEFLMIAGAGVGTLFLANGADVARRALAAPARVFTGARWRAADYAALSALLADLMMTARQRGVFAIEDDIEHPLSSARFTSAPLTQKDTEAREMICEVFRKLGIGRLEPAAGDALMSRRIERALTARMRPVAALERLAETLPALGIVAAVLGVIKSMAAIDQSTAILGQMIASALVGTLLGVFLAYGIVAPIAARLAQIVEEDTRPLDVIAETLTAWLAGESAAAACEAGLALLPPDIRPETPSAGVASVTPLRRAV